MKMMSALTIIAGDFHLPNQDSLLVRKWIEFISVNQPNLVIINGDLLDMWELSKFDKVPKSGEGIEKEFELGKLFFQTLRKYYHGRVVLVEGNHDFRIKTFLISVAPQLYGIHGLCVEDQLELDRWNVEYIQSPSDASKWQDCYIEVEDIYVGHFNLCRADSGATAKALVNKYGVSIIQNHVHRYGVFQKKLINGKYLTGVENFCMCDLNPGYMRNANWNQGFSVIRSGQIIPIPYSSGNFIHL